MFECHDVLKDDAFGAIEKGVYYADENSPRITAIQRVYTQHKVWGIVARFLANNEKRAIKKLAAQYPDSPYFPQLLQETDNAHVRSYIEGDSLHRCERKIPHDYFLQCKKLLRQMRAQGVSNNDLAKEANWLITENNQPAVTDFQLAACFKRKSSKLALILGREDLRHLLKHKRMYDVLTPAELNVVNRKSFLSRLWQYTGKKVYHFVTRKLLGWKERTGPEERDF